ncbi:MAG: hypothetical protein HY897_17415 [Deltaproteobacteria bacterium]|nr:hypothetical protein [Deltaproteobacteria bacterium]
MIQIDGNQPNRGRLMALVLVLLFVAVGCAASGPIFRPIPIPDRQAVIYLYAAPPIDLPFGMRSNNLSYIRVNGRVVTKMMNDGYFPCVVKPGRVEFAVRQVGIGGPGNELPGIRTLEVEDGKEYYVMVGNVPGGIGSGGAGGSFYVPLPSGGAVVGSAPRAFGIEFSLVDPAKGAEEIKSRRLLDESN